jgi:phage-related protein
VKPILWRGTTLTAVREFAEPARQQAGYQLYRVQCGLEPSDWKPMSIVGPNVREIRIHTADEFRVIYVASFEEAVYVLHAFQKKTRKTSKRDLALAAERFRELTKARKEKHRDDKNL